MHRAPTVGASARVVGTEADGLLICEERRFDPIRGINSTVMCWDEGGERQEVRFEVRLYTPTKLTCMIEAAGLQPVVHYGDWVGSELTHESRRMILVAERPAEGA